MELIAIKETQSENEEFIHHRLCESMLPICIDFYKKVGFAPPWICYFVKRGDEFLAGAAFKGKPVNGTVEIAYGTFDGFMQQGIATAVCQKLVELSLQTDASIRIKARTLPENNFSTRVLEKNGFLCKGSVQDPEDGAVWEWEYQVRKEGCITTVK